MVSRGRFYFLGGKPIKISYCLLFECATPNISFCNDGLLTTSIVKTSNLCLPKVTVPKTKNLLGDELSVTKGVC